MQYFIKNMVCNRCIMVVQQRLKSWAIHLYDFLERSKPPIQSFTMTLKTPKKLSAMGLN